MENESKLKAGGEWFSWHHDRDDPHREDLYDSDGTDDFDFGFNGDGRDLAFRLKSSGLLAEIARF